MVCKAFRDAIKHPAVWSDVTFYANAGLNDEKLEALMLYWDAGDCAPRSSLQLSGKAWLVHSCSVSRAGTPTNCTVLLC